MCGASTTFVSGAETGVDLRLLLEHVEPRPGDPALLEGADQRRLVHDRAPRRVHEDRRSSS